MRYTFCLFIILGFNSLFGQFKFLKNQYGDPVTEIIDPMQMQQGKWLYYDHLGLNFRTEVFNDNVLISNQYFTINGTKDVKTFNQLDLSLLTNDRCKVLYNKLVFYGNGEIIVSEDNTISIHFYFDKIKNQPDFKNIDLSVLKSMELSKSIIKF